MQKETGLKVASIIFGIVALLHLTRVLAGWSLAIDDFVVPKWLSIIAFLVLGWLSYDLFKITKTR